MSEIRPPNGRLGPACVWCGGGVVAQFPTKVKWRQGVHRHRQRYMHRGTAEARTGAWVRVSARVCVTESKRKKTRRGDGKERDTRGKCQDLSPCLVFIRAQEARAHTESSRSRVGTGHPRPGSPALQGWVFLHSICARLLRARRLSSFRLRSRCRHPTLPRPAPTPSSRPALSSYHHAPSPHRRAPARV